MTKIFRPTMAISRLCLLAFSFFAFAATSVFPQTVWFKYQANPVLTRGSVGTWDDESVFPSRVIYQDTVYRMWYTGWDGSFWRTGHATSSDGVNWTKTDGNPVLSQGPQAWESGGSSEAYVIVTPTGYQMWYMGEDFSENWRIGYAASSDGLTWSKINPGGNPILGPGSWYARGPHNPSVLGPDSLGGYMMWFQGEPLDHADFQIGFATAPNETTWTPTADSVLSWGTAGSWDDDKVMCPRVIHDGQIFEMWYCGERTDARTQIGYATSLDGITWTRHGANPVLRRGPASWDAQDLYSLDVLFKASLYHMWYGGMDRLPSVPKNVGYAISPKGMTFSVSTPDSIFNSVDDTIVVYVGVDDPSGLRFSARILSGAAPVDTVELFDDGAHEDSLAGDGFFANRWIPAGSSVYSVDLLLTLHDTLNFEMKNAAVNLVTTVRNAEFIAPQGYHLSHNFPNPFNPTTEIRYQISEVSHVTLKVFDMLGREVATLVNEELSPGSYEVTWDAAGFPSGTYFYKLTTGEFVETKKLLLLR